MRPYILATAAALLMAGPAMAQSYGGGWDGVDGVHPAMTSSGPSANPQSAQAPASWEPYSEQLNQGNGPMTEQPNQNYPDNGRMTAPQTYYGAPYGSGAPSQ